MATSTERYTRFLWAMLPRRPRRRVLLFGLVGDLVAPVCEHHARLGPVDKGSTLPRSDTRNGVRPQYTWRHCSGIDPSR